MLTIPTMMAINTTAMMAMSAVENIGLSVPATIDGAGVTIDAVPTDKPVVSRELQ